MKIIIYDHFCDLPTNIQKEELNYPIFLTSYYAKIMKETKGYITSWYVGYENDIPLYIIPFGVQSKFGFNKGLCLFSTFCLRQEMASNEKEKEYINSVLTTIRKNKTCDWVEQSPNHALFSIVPDQAQFCEFGSFRVNLTDVTEDVSVGIRKQERRAIRRAITDGVEIKFGVKYLKDAYALITNTISEAKLSNFDIDRIITETKILGDLAIIAVGYYKEEAQSAVIAFRTNHSIYGIHSGSKKDQVRGTTNLIFKDIYQLGAYYNVKYFDFVGARKHVDPESKLFRIQQFKRHMGGELVEGYLWKLTINKPKHFIYKIYTHLNAFIKHKTYRKDIIDQENLKNRS